MWKKVWAKCIPDILFLNSDHFLEDLGWSSPKHAETFQEHTEIFQVVDGLGSWTRGYFAKIPRTSGQDPFPMFDRVYRRNVGLCLAWSPMIPWTLLGNVPIAPHMHVVFEIFKYSLIFTPPQHQNWHSPVFHSHLDEEVFLMYQVPRMFDQPSHTLPIQGL